MERHRTMMEATGNSMTHGGAATAVFFGYMTLNDVAAAVGILCSLAGLVLSWYWKHKYYEMDKNRLQWDRRRFIRRGTPQQDMQQENAPPCSCQQAAANDDAPRGDEDGGNE